MSLFLLLLIPFTFNAKDTLPRSSGQDTSLVLENIVVQAFEANRKLIDVASPISLVQNRDLNRYNNATIVEAFNVSPGVRMEERSPGSYRMNIRGSSLRAPFGVRNVKIYMNGIPFTDPGGNSYLNQFDFYNIASAEIIKGPAGSIYGAGTGGVILLNSSTRQQKPGISLNYTGGSYNMHHVNATADFGREKGRNRLSFSHLSSDGYREHTQMRRDGISWEGSLKETENSKIKTYFFYGDMRYQTPGALTKEEFVKNPGSARPAAGPNPSAEEARAQFRSQTFFAGFSAENKLGKNWKNMTSVYGAYSQNRNPNFRNYSRTSEPHFGGRTVFTATKEVGNATLAFAGGAEFQKGFYGQRVYKNNGGEPGALQTDDEAFNTIGFVFGQATAEVRRWQFTLGASYNDAVLDFRRFTEPENQIERRNFNNQLAPRLAVLRKLGDYFSVYANVAKGFSAPTTSELLPSTDVFNTDLQPETGTNVEAGMKALLFDKLYADINVFYYSLTNAIVQLRDASGGDYFRNAGSARQAGIESYFSSTLLNRPAANLSYIRAYISNTLFNFKYHKYEQGGKDYSGNKLPGVAATTLAAGVDLRFLNGFYSNLTWFQSSKIAMNDANTEWANPYGLLGMKIGYEIKLKESYSISLFCGGQNLLDQTYSLGNDINAFGGRYYNAASRRNFYAGIGLHPW